jgi:hypothetical protein
MNKLQYSPEIRKICPQAEHNFDHLLIIRRVWPLQLLRKQESKLISMGHSCVKGMNRFELR